MPDHETAMCAFAQLAALSDQKKQALIRDRFLLLAGVAACRAGWLDVAERCRELLSHFNPAHQVNRHSTMVDAMRDADFQRLVSRWERYCSFEQAEQLLGQLGLKAEGDQPEVPRGEWVLQSLRSICSP